MVRRYFVEWRRVAHYLFLPIPDWNFCSQNDFICQIGEFFLASLAAQVRRVPLDFNSEFL